MPTKDKALMQAQESIADFFKLSKYLLGDNAPYDANEIPKDSPYYNDARALVEELGIDWDNMTHEDSNRVFINLLSDYYMNIRTDENYIPVLSITFKKAK